MDSVAWARGVHFFTSCPDVPSTCFLPLDRGKTAARWWFGNKVPAQVGFKKLRKLLGYVKPLLLRHRATRISFVTLSVCQVKPGRRIIVCQKIHWPFSLIKPP